MSQGSPAPNRNTLWARTLADEWARLGVRDVCLGSGSRSAPLVEAFARDGRFRLHPHVDERSAAFFALGLAARTGVPAAVVTTSGTAAANLYPAVIEAGQGEIPLLVLTADRPERLRGTDANQTIDQGGLFAGYPRLEIDLGLPRATGEALRDLRSNVARAWAATVGDPPGPAHVNAPFEKPLEPIDVEGDVPPDLNAAGSGDAPVPRRAEGVGQALLPVLRGARRPVLVCGPTHRPGVGRAALRLASALRAPLLADPLSGARFAEGAVEGVIPHVDLALGADEVSARLTPDVVVRVGRVPTSASVQRWLIRHGDRSQIVVDAGGRWTDSLGVADRHLVGDPVATLEQLAGAAAAGTLEPAEPSWLARWRRAGSASAEALAPDLERWFEGAIAAAIAAALPDGGLWFIGNSMPIRDVDAFSATRDAGLDAIGLRGASGIDGNVSAALGAAAPGGPAVALLGDLTLLHDVGALLFAPARDISLQVVVIQNRGGGIFHMLPIRDFDPPFTPYIVMPHDVDVSAVAAAARIPHRPVASLADLRDELEAGWGTPGVRLIEAEIERGENWRLRAAATARAQEAARAAL